MEQTTEFFGIGIGLIGLLLGVLSTIFWIWMLVDAAIKEKGASKVAWVIIIALLSCLGAAVYFFVRKLPR